MSLKDIGIILLVVAVFFIWEMIFNSENQKSTLKGIGKVIDDFRRWINKI